MAITTAAAVTTGGKAIVAGTAVASSSLFAELVIFQDKSYAVLAFAGAIVSAFGVIHEIANSPENAACTKRRIAGKIIKGLFVGFMAIPFMFLLLSGIGEALLSKSIGVDKIKIANSLWLILSFGSSWYAVQILDFFTQYVVGWLKKKKDGGTSL